MVQFFPHKRYDFCIVCSKFAYGGFLYYYDVFVFYGQCPEALGEAARIDGAGEFRILLKIVMPISKPMKDFGADGWPGLLE